MAARLPKVGIVVSNYNYGTFLEECLASVKAQTYPNLDVVVVDDQSSDNSNELITRLQDVYNFKYQRNKENSGQTITLRNGLRALDPNTQFVHFLDADDVLLPNCIDDLVNVFLSIAPSYTFVFGLGNYIDEHSQLVAGQTHFFSNSKHESHDGINLLDPSSIKFPDYPIQATTSGIMFRKTAASMILEHEKSAGLRICTDGLLVHCLFYISGAAFINKTVYNYRLHGRNNFVNVSVFGEMRNDPAADRELQKTVVEICRSLIKTQKINKVTNVHFLKNYCSESELIELGYKEKQIKRLRSLQRYDKAIYPSRMEKIVFASRKRLGLFSSRRNIFGLEVANSSET